MTTDRLAGFSHTPIARLVGVPAIPVLRRHTPGAPLLDGPALVGAVGAGTFAKQARALLGEAGIVEAGNDGKVAAVVLDAAGASTVDDLSTVQAFLTPAVRRLAPSGRLVVIGPLVGGDPEAAAVAQALEGIVRSAGKEVRAGATANLLVVEPDANIESALGFFLSGRSAYVSGQVVRVGASVSGAPPADPERPLTGRLAVVTGAARGIGAAIAATLARDGAGIVAVDVPAAGAALSEVANRAGGTALQLDITAPDAAERLLAHVRERHGRLDVMVHNAGITRDKLLANMDADRWNAVLAVNLRAQLAINEALLGSDVLGETGRIVCVASTSGIAGNRGQTNYAASKAGVIGMVRATAPRIADRGATINAVAPGFIETEMTAKMPLGTREAGRRINSLRQGGLPVDVAETVGWLGSSASGGVTGQVVRVCGQSLLGA
ncbi:3-oxoacyl-ACP reductase [Pseudonocardia sp. TRM90224]|uniref:3-oxoacyl-ACP reductase n=1 Tax=Pseudonocardia sp. TRM90224 TaxID=2812678 RepID=UPI001E287CD2|nr:3-oxoacyl-ACP reductase [Pseudonocardia sp. TRM90224]